MILVTLYFIIINLVGLFLMWDDKKRAVKHQYRIREKTLWLAAWLGGAVGTSMGMKWFRHKTKHPSFRLGFPVLAAIDLILFIYYRWHYSGKF